MPPLAEIIQGFIHKLETGAAQRATRISAFVLAVLALALLYDLRCWRNLSTAEGMDAAQLARNLAEGRGYTTLCIRPFSLYLLKRFDEQHGYTFGTNGVPDFARLRTPHPDLAHPPVWPVVLAGWMKLLPFHYSVNLKSSFWSDNGRFTRYEPDFLITLLNQLLLLVVVGLTFFLARKLFDSSVAWMAATVTLGCELLWRFSDSGLSTLLLMVIFLGVAWCLANIEEGARQTSPREGRLLGWIIAAGVLTAVGALTRYAFGWAIIPVILFIVLFSGPRRRVPHALAAAAAFGVVLTPWVLRNYAVSGTPFGTAGYAAVEATSLFPGFELERSLHPNLDLFVLFPVLHKTLNNLRDIFQNGLPRLGGSWISLLFFTGLLLAFRSAAVRRMRYFLLMCLGIFAVVQAAGRTQLAVESPVVNSENLLVLLAPLVFIYGASLFFTLLDQMPLPLPQWRYVVMAVFVAVCCLPLLSALALPRTNPVAYPPYYPPDIQKAAGWLQSNELMMSDVPWAVAWYGHRPCVWLTLNAEDDFFAVNDDLKPVVALYLTPVTLDEKLLSDWIRGRDRSWGHFILQTVDQSRIPKDFPLRYLPTGSAAISSGLFLTDWERWKQPVK